MKSWKNTLRATAVLSSVAIVAAGLSTPAVAAEQEEFTEVTDTVSLIEAVTGIDSLVEVAPGESGEAVTVPEDTSEPVNISAAGVTIEFEQPIVIDSAVEVSVSDEGTVSYINESENFNTHLQVLESPDEALLSEGVRSLIEIQSADAPTEYEYDVTLDEGTTLEVLQDGTVTGVRDGETTLVIPAPWAVDAAGTQVPTHYEIRDGSLIQHVSFTEENVFPVIADPVWFVPLIVAGARVIGQVAINAATRAAAVRAAAAIAARKVIKTVVGRITSAAAKRCYKGAAVGSVASVPAYLQQKGDGSWQVRFNGNGALTTISASVAGCLSANIR